MTVADRIKERREALNLTQEELAKRMGYKGKSSVCKIENAGDNISLKTIKKVASALGTTHHYLMGWEETSFTPDYIVQFKTEGSDELLEAFVELNRDGQKEAVKRIRELAYNPRFSKYCGKEFPTL